VSGVADGAGDLAGRLCGLGYVELFHRATDEAVEAVWSEPGAPQRLRSLALDAAALPEARFLAAEILAWKRAEPPAAEEKAALGPVYAGALARNHTRFANAWGIPGHGAGQAERNLVALGEAAVPALAGLLDDDTPVTYSGSQEATLGNSYRFRVSDLALYFLREIRGEPLDVREEPAERDRQIRAMRAALREPGTGGGTT
jgi:hypothetical protein